MRVPCSTQAAGPEIMVIQQVGSRGRVAAERRGGHSEDKKQVRPDQVYMAFLPCGLHWTLQADCKALKVRNGLSARLSLEPNLVERSRAQELLLEVITDTLI